MGDNQAGNDGSKSHEHDLLSLTANSAMFREATSSGGAGPPFARPSTSGAQRRTLKERVVTVTSENLNELVGQISDLRNRSFYN